MAMRMQGLPETAGVGVVGVGVRGQHSYEVWLASRPDCRIVAVAQQPDPSAAMLEGKDPVGCTRDWAARFGAEFMDDWRELVARPDVHLISLMADPLAAPLVTQRVAQAGKPMVRDKYLGADLAGARRALRACEAASVEMLVTYNVRYLPAVQQLLSELRGNGIGRPLTASFVYLISGGPLASFIATAEYAHRVGGGELTCFGVYALDVVLEVFGALPERVSASQGTFFYPDYLEAGLEDLSQVTLRFADGGLAHVLTGRTTTRPHPDCYFHLDVMGETGTLRALGPEPRHRCFAGQTDVLPWQSWAAVTAMVDDFVSRLCAGQPSPIPARRGYEVLQIVKAAYLSAREARAVSLAEAESAGL